VIGGLFFTPLAINYFADTFFPELMTMPAAIAAADSDAAKDANREGAARSGAIGEPSYNSNSRNSTADASGDRRSVRGNARRRANGDGRNEPEQPRRVKHFWVHATGITSPFSAAFNVPLKTDPLERDDDPEVVARRGSWGLYGGFVAFTLALNATLLSLIVWLFNVRWRVSE